MAKQDHSLSIKLKWCPVMANAQGVIIPTTYKCFQCLIDSRQKNRVMQTGAIHFEYQECLRLPSHKTGNSKVV